MSNNTSNEELVSKVFGIVSYNIAGNWVLWARHLGLRDSDIENIDNDYHKGSMKADQVLRIWKQKEKDFSLKLLKSKLESFNRFDILSIINKDLKGVFSNSEDLSNSNAALVYQISQHIKEDFERKFVTQEQFDVLASKVDYTYDMLNKRIRMVETTINELVEWQVYIDETLTGANVFSEIEIKRKFDLLKDEHGQLVYDYATKFYWTLSYSLQAYKMISTGLIKKEINGYTGAVEKTSKALNTGSKILKCLKEVDISQSFSIASGIINIVNGFFKLYSNVKLDRITKKVVDSITGPLLEKDFDLAIASSSYNVALARKPFITETGAQESTQLDGVKKWLSDTVEKLAALITGINGVPESKVSLIVMEDVSLFIISSIVYSDDKLVESNDVIHLSQKIEELFKVNVAIKVLLKDLNKKALS